MAEAIIKLMLTEQVIFILVLTFISILFTSFDRLFKSKKNTSAKEERLRHYLFSRYSVATIM